jgi:DNA polymerase V
MKDLLMYIKDQSAELVPLDDEENAAIIFKPNVAEAIKIDLNSYIAKYPNAVHYAKVVGECMISSGIFPGDLLMVDRSLTPDIGDIVVALSNGEYLLRGYFKKENREYLIADNPYRNTIELKDTTSYEIWGVVPLSVLNQRRRNNARINRFEKSVNQNFSF